MEEVGAIFYFISLYHPQMDGQTEVINRSLVDFLRSLVTKHHSQWDHILPQEEFSYNDSINRRTGKSPFQIIYEMKPRGVSELKDVEQDEFKSAGAEDFAEAMKELHSRVKERL
jgi:hypothetical protein